MYLRGWRGGSGGVDKVVNGMASKAAATATIIYPFIRIKRKRDRTLKIRSLIKPTL